MTGVCKICGHSFSNFNNNETICPKCRYEENWNKLYSTKEILDSKNINRFAIEVSKGVDYEYKETPIHPYLLGLMLGDGSFTISKYNQAQFTSREEDVLVYSNLLHIPFKRVGNTKTQWLIDYPEFGKKARELNLHNKI